MEKNSTSVSAFKIRKTVGNKKNKQRMKEMWYGWGGEKNLAHMHLPLHSFHFSAKRMSVCFPPFISLSILLSCLIFQT